MSRTSADSLRRTLIISNDFPPRIGGIESFVSEVAQLLDHDVVVLTSGNGPADVDHDRGLDYPVHRRGRMLLPTRSVGRLAAQLLRRHGADRVIFGAAAPLSLLAPTLRAAGAKRILAISHGHEIWWAVVPGARQLLRRMAVGVDVWSTISDFTAARLGPVFDPEVRERMIRLAPPVDLDRFHPAATTQQGHRAQPPRCIAVGRFITQKGFATLLDAWPLVLAGPAGERHPELVLVGDGPQRRRLRRQVASSGSAGSVGFTGPLTRDQVADALRSAQVFALPVRTRLAGLNPEGFGLVFAEAAASGLPVLVGRSGGAPETVLPGRSGYVVDSRDPGELADRLTELLTQPERAIAMGQAGREHVRGQFSTTQARVALRRALHLD